MAVAGIAVAKDAVPMISQELKKILLASPKTGEVKWDNSKSFGGFVHRAYVDYLFELIHGNRAHFHIRFSPMNEYNHAESGPRKRIDTVSKSYFQLLLHRPVRLYGNKLPIHVYPDDGECTEALHAQKDKLHFASKREFPKYRNISIPVIEPRSSRREPLLQMLDVTLGALAAIKNERHLSPNTNPIKRDLALYVLSKTGWPDLRYSNSGKNARLNKWIVKPKHDQRR